MFKPRISGEHFWPEAKSIIENFPEAAKALATEKADEEGLAGIRRKLSIYFNAHRIKGFKQDYAIASMLRAGFGSQETAKELLEVFAYPESKVGMRYPIVHCS